MLYTLKKRFEIKCLDVWRTGFEIVALLSYIAQHVLCIACESIPIQDNAFVILK